MLDVFAKKSTSGISTPKADIDRIVGRLKSLRHFRTKTPEGIALVKDLNVEYGKKLLAAEDDRKKSYGQHTRKPKGT